MKVNDIKRDLELAKKKIEETRLLSLFDTLESSIEKCKEEKSRLKRSVSPGDAKTLEETGQEIKELESMMNSFCLEEKQVLSSLGALQ